MNHLKAVNGFVQRKEPWKLRKDPKQDINEGAANSYNVDPTNSPVAFSFGAGVEDGVEDRGGVSISVKDGGVNVNVKDSGGVSVKDGVKDSGGVSVKDSGGVGVKDGAVDNQLLADSVVAFALYSVQVCYVMLCNINTLTQKTFILRFNKFTDKYKLDTNVVSLILILISLIFTLYMYKHTYTYSYR